jgi:hypothetical protein
VQLRPLHLYVALWVVVSTILAREYVMLNGTGSGPSLLQWMNTKGLFGADMMRGKLDPSPGKALSFRLGWIGFSIICLTNLYILRKRLPQMQKLGKVSHWLDFHIFCGLMGPTIIIFHTNFQVGGLVAVSFWCMMTSFASGVVGRYFYTQILKQRADLKQQLTQLDTSFKKLEELNHKVFSAKRITKLKEDAFVFSGGSVALVQGRADILTVLAQSLIGDVKLMFNMPPVPQGFPSSLKRPLKQYAVARRRLAASPYFRRLMGYWHAFHMPFAIFMYLVSVIHIVSALVFRVDH